MQMFIRPVRLNDIRTRPVDWDFVKRCLRNRRDQRDRKRQGYRHYDIVKTHVIGEIWNRITDVKIDADRRGVWIKTEVEK